jgi:hypothetical protein
MSLHWKKSLKIFFSRTCRPISIKLDTNHSCIKEIQVYTNKRTGHLQMGDNCKNAKIGWGHLNFPPQEPQSQKS